MRKLAIVLFLAIAAVLGVVHFILAATAPWDFSMSEATFTEVLVTWESSVKAGVIDTLRVVNVSDSTLVAVVDSAGIANKEYLVTGLSPNTTYRWRIAINDTSGTTTYSNADTLATNNPAPTDVVLSSPTSTTMVVKFTSACNKAFLDSILIVDVSDSTTVALVDSTTMMAVDSLDVVTYTVTGLSPATTYRWRVAISDTSATAYYSNADTLATKYPIFTVPSNVKLPFAQKIYNARSWPASNTLGTFTVTGTAADSSGIYFPKEYTSLLVTAAQAGDSCKATILVYAGLMSDTGTMVSALVDSVNITTKGTKLQQLNIPTSEHIRYFVQGRTGNGKSATYSIIQTIDAE